MQKNKNITYDKGVLDMNKKSLVYAHVNNANDKKYIGITSINVNDRWANGMGYKNNEGFFKDIVKYGWDNFEHLILTDYICTSEALRIEEELIAEHKTNNIDFGYNISCDEYRRSRYKAVYQYTKDWEFVAKYRSAVEASQITGFNSGAIGACCSGKQKTHKGFIWVREDYITRPNKGVRV